MKRISPVASVLAAGAVVLAVSSCAPAVHATSAPTTHPHITAAPHPTQAAIPSVRVPVTCASLFDDTAAGKIIDQPVAIHVDETTPPVDITDITERQYGSLNCVWADGRQDTGYDDSLRIDITPDAAAGFAANLAGFAAENAPTTSNTAGDKSVYGCVAEGAVNCVGNMLVGSYWVTANIQELSNDSATLPAANARIQLALSTVAASLKTAKAAPAWNPPGAALPGFCTAPGATSQLNTLLGVTDLTVAGEDEGSSDAASYTQRPEWYSQCTWQGASNSGPYTFVSIALLRGGAWVMPQLPGETNPRAYMLSAYKGMTVPGATAAAGDCSTQADECLVTMTIGSVLVQVDMDDPSDAQSMAALTKLVAAIKAS